MRFTSSTCPDNTALPNRTNGNTPPCTETGFTGSDNCLIPEMMYEESPITNGAIYEIDKEGNEVMVGYWNGKRFVSVDEKGE